MDLNISVKVLGKRAPYLLLWWNDKHDCVDGVLVTCPCQGYDISKPVDGKKNTERGSVFLSKALQRAEIGTLYPSRIGQSLCTEEDILREENEKKMEEPAKPRRKRGRRKEDGRKNDKRKRHDVEETPDHMEHVVNINSLGGNEVCDRAVGDLSSGNPKCVTLPVNGKDSGRISNLCTKRVGEDETISENYPDGETFHTATCAGAADSETMDPCKAESELSDSAGGEILQNEERSTGERQLCQDGFDSNASQKLLGSLVVTVQMPDNDKLASNGDIPQAIVAMMEEVCASSIGDHGVPVTAAFSDISPPITSDGGIDTALVPDTNAHTYDPSTSASPSVMADAIPVNISYKSISDPVPAIGVPNPLYTKDLSDPEKVDEWKRLHKLNTDKFLAKCNKKRRWFVQFMLCEVCGAALCSKTYQNHMEYQHYHVGERKPQFSCKTCGKKFMYAAHVSRHELIHQKVRFQCSFCPKSFSQSGACRIHEKTHSGVSDREQLGKRLDPWVKCLECGAQVRKSYMKKHMEVHDPSIPPAEPIVCLECGRTYGCKGSLATHMKMHGEKNYSCSVCNKKFHLKMTLETHMRIHTKEKPLLCRHCGEGFSRHQARINHERRKHTGVKPYYCHVCDKRWRDRVTFTQHMKRLHPDEPIMTLKNRPHTPVAHTTMPVPASDIHTEEIPLGLDS